MLIKEGGIRAKPQHLTCPSLLPLTCFSPLLCCLSAFIFSPCTSWPDPHLSVLSLLCLHFYIPLSLSLSLRSVTLSFTLSVGGRALLGKTPASEFMERLLWQQTHTWPYPSLFNCTVCLLFFFFILAIVKPFFRPKTSSPPELFSWGHKFSSGGKVKDSLWLIRKKKHWAG